LKKMKRLPNTDADTLDVPVKPGDSRERVLADMVASGIAGNAFTLKTFAAGTFGPLKLRECVAALKASASEIQAHDLKRAEFMLAVQASALDAIFGELARRAAANMGQYSEATERYMRLALKAQGQCRATLETLAAMKNPPVMFAGQANIANGPQQVNNAAAPHGGGIENFGPSDSGTALGLTQGISSPIQIKGAETRAREATAIEAKRTIRGPHS
jgi:hypothetical protein